MHIYIHVHIHMLIHIHIQINLHTYIHIHKYLSKEFLKEIPYSRIELETQP